MDPNGNITATIDILSWKDDNSYMVRIISNYLRLLKILDLVTTKICLQARATIQNFYQYRRTGKPGWRLGWTWAGKEIILSMAGAVATQQGDCSEFKSLPSVPYSCKTNPVIVDRTPDTAGENWTSHCCHGGILSARAIDQPRSFSSFDMHIGNLNGNNSVSPPINLTLLAPGLGYTCNQLEDVPPTVFKVDGGKREEQVFSKILETLHTCQCIQSLAMFSIWADIFIKGVTWASYLQTDKQLDLALITVVWVRLIKLTSTVDTHIAHLIPIMWISKLTVVHVFRSWSNMKKALTRTHGHCTTMPNI